MLTLNSRILVTFLAKIAESNQVNDTIIQSIGDMLGNSKLPKPEDLARLYAACSEDSHA